MAALKMTYSDSFDYSVMGETVDGRNLYEARIGNPNAETVILIQAGIHAREYMTSQLVMKQMEFLLYYAGEAQYGDILLSEMLEQVCFCFVPMMNPDGIAISQFGLNGVYREGLREELRSWYERDYADKVTKASMEEYLRLWKANANGVDLNRNFPYGFDDYKGASKPASQKYKGKYAVSETETDALVRLTRIRKPVFTVSYHATGSVLYWDYGQTGELREECRSLVEMISGVNSNEIRYATSDKQDAAGYGDWCVMVEGIPSVTIEIGTGSAPLSIEEFEKIWKRNALIPAALAEYAINNY